MYSLVGIVWNTFVAVLRRTCWTLVTTIRLIVESTAPYVLASMRGVPVDKVRADDVSVFRIVPECVPMVTRAAVNCVLL